MDVVLHNKSQVAQVFKHFDAYMKYSLNKKLNNLRLMGLLSSRV